MKTYHLKNYGHVEVTRLLDEMEACVNRVKVLCSEIKTGWGEG